ncbi:MAG: hypothetical protein H7Y36_11955 [Armatimonadetes bacterium]|nr:hypothetical protein [Akkermansiaceae bacterium]
MQTARANARLALQLAIADLQKYAGPDQRITATAETILPSPVPPAIQTSGQPMLTGVWKSRKLDPNDPDTEADQTKTGRSLHFSKWLTSCGSPTSTEAQDFASGGVPPAKAEILVSEKVVGTDLTAIKVSAERVNVMDAKVPTLVRGTYAYAVLDEGVKASINVGTNAVGTGLAGQAAALGGGQQPGIDRLKLPAGAGDFTLASVNLDRSTTDGKSLVNKLISRGNGELGLKLDLPTANSPGALGKNFHDLTPYSLGLLTNVADGGFKRDLNLLAELPTLPAEYAGKKIYKTSFKDAPGPGWNELASDPKWDRAFSYLNLFKAKTYKNEPVLFDSPDGPVMRATAPRDWKGGKFVKQNNATITNLNPTGPDYDTPSGPVLLPAIAKVQVVFSLCVRDMAKLEVPGQPPLTNGPENFIRSLWETGLKGTGWNYLLTLNYAPIITLHNPYNVPIEFSGADDSYLQIDLVNVPFAMQVERNGEPQMKDFATLGSMKQGLNKNLNNWSIPYVEKPVSPTKRFGMRIANGVNAAGQALTTPIRMLPGEVRVFSVWMPPTRTWGQEQLEAKYFDDWASTQLGFDPAVSDGDDNTFWTKTDTSKTVAVPGWTGVGSGFSTHNLASGPEYNLKDDELPDNPKGYRGNTIPLKVDDKIRVKFAPIAYKKAPQPYRFSVEMTLRGANADKTARTSVLEFNIGAVDGLQKQLLGNNGFLSYPPEGEDPRTRSELYNNYQTDVQNLTKARPFALFSAYAGTTQGGVEVTDGGVPSYDNGRYPAKPWLFGNHAGLVSTKNVENNNESSMRSHEMNFTYLPGNTLNAVRAGDRGTFVTGHTALDGRPFGTLFDVPLGPVQSLCALNGAGLATSIYQPCFVQPVGNSYAHPLLDTSSIREGDLADHSYLLNSIFYDGYYCSGIQTRSSTIGDGKTAAALAGTFFNGASELSDPRLTPYFADGGTPTAAVASVLSGEGFKKVAALQLVKGSFNVNSTSEEAWKAMLSAMTGKGARILEVPTAQPPAVPPIQTVVAKDLTETPADFMGARFSRFRVPNSQPITSTGSEDDNKASYWQGGRDLTEAELTTLAKEIVTQVKQRGPFLSMSEFVNRELGAAGDLTLAGALQTAIDKSGINSGAATYGGGYEITSTQTDPLELETKEALQGSSAAGAPGYLMQGDVLNVLGNSATVRSDTFVIRTYGDARDSSGKVTARAWCEAVVQRVPEYVDQADTADTAPGVLTSQANKDYGRRFTIQSFRYLQPDEV